MHDEIDEIEAHYRRLEAMYERAPVNHTIPSRLAVSEGRAEVTMSVDRRYWHAADSLHGSMYFKALDDAAFFAANSMLTDALVLTARFEVELLARVTATSIKAVGQLDRQEGKKLEASSVLYASDQVVGRGRGLFVASRLSLADIALYREADGCEER